MNLFQWLFYTEDETLSAVLYLEEKIVALSAEVAALQTAVVGLKTSVDAAVPALGQPGMSAEDKAVVIAATSDVSSAAQKLSAATPPAPPPAPPAPPA